MSNLFVDHPLVNACGSYHYLNVITDSKIDGASYTQL